MLTIVMTDIDRWRERESLSESLSVRERGGGREKEKERKKERERNKKNIERGREKVCQQKYVSRTYTLYIYPCCVLSIL
jgi:hypothetical protein